MILDENNVDNNDINKIKYEVNEIVSTNNKMFPNMLEHIEYIDNESDSYEFVNGTEIYINDDDDKDLTENKMPTNTMNVICTSQLGTHEGELKIECLIERGSPKGMTMMEEIAGLCSMGEKEVMPKTEDKAMTGGDKRRRNQE